MVFMAHGNVYTSESNLIPEALGFTPMSGPRARPVTGTEYGTLKMFSIAGNCFG